jgi:hypothetical protein
MIASSASPAKGALPRIGAAPPIPVPTCQPADRLLHWLVASCARRGPTIATNDRRPPCNPVRFVVEATRLSPFA